MAFVSVYWTLIVLGVPYVLLFYIILGRWPVPHLRRAMSTGLCSTHGHFAVSCPSCTTETAVEFADHVWSVELQAHKSGTVIACLVAGATGVIIGGVLAYLFLHSYR